MTKIPYEHLKPGEHKFLDELNNIDKDFTNVLFDCINFRKTVYELRAEGLLNVANREDGLILGGQIESLLEHSPWAWTLPELRKLFELKPGKYKHSEYGFLKSSIFTKESTVHTHTLKNIIGIGDYDYSLGYDHVKQVIGTYLKHLNVYPAHPFFYCKQHQSISRILLEYDQSKKPPRWFRLINVLGNENRVMSTHTLASILKCDRNNIAPAHLTPSNVPPNFLNLFMDIVDYGGKARAGKRGGTPAKYKIKENFYNNVFSKIKPYLNKPELMTTFGKLYHPGYKPVR